MPQYAAFDPETLVVQGLVDSPAMPEAVAGAPYAYGQLATALTQFPVAPFPGAVLVYAAASQSLQWQDTRPLFKVRSDRIEVLKLAREAAVATSFVWDGSTFDADETAQVRLALLGVAATQAGYQPTAWRLADNTWRTLSAADAVAVCQALAAHLRAKFDLFQQRETDVLNASSKSAIDAVTWG